MKLCLFIISGENCYKKVNFHSVPFIVQTLFVCALIARWSKKLCFLCYLHLGKSLLSFAEAEAASEYFVCPPLFWIIFVIKRLFSAFASEAKRQQRSVKDNNNNNEKSLKPIEATIIASCILEASMCNHKRRRRCQEHRKEPQGLDIYAYIYCMTCNKPYIPKAHLNLT